MNKLKTLLVSLPFLLIPLEIKNISQSISEEGLIKYQKKRNLKNDISLILNKKEFSYRKDHGLKEDYFSQKENMTFNELQVIHILLRNLEKKEFVEKLGKIIEADVRDLYSEHGGIIKKNKEGILELVVLKSDLPRLRKNNNYYLPPEKIDSLDYFFEFHLHASTYGEKKFSGPGNLDIMIQEARAHFRGEIHEIVITSLEKNKFNIDYYWCNKKMKNTKIVDLGNYFY